MLLEIETALVNRLTSKLGPEMGVESFPARPEDYRLRHPRGAVLVSYARTDFGPPRDLGMVVQDRVMTFALVVLVRNLRTHAESLLWLDAIRATLTGFIPVAGAGQCYPYTERFVQENNGIWTWELAVRLTLPQVADEEADLANLLRHITTLDGMEQVDVEKTDNVITITETPRDSEICVNTE